MPDSTPLLPRSSRYQIVERLGEGGMAVVFRCVDNEERRWCALKVLLPEYRQNPTVRARFQAEARALSALDHRHLIKIFDVHVDEDIPYFVMELATGGSLIEWSQAYGPMPPRMAVDVAIQLTKALRVAHDQGMVHRDVKPHNVLVTRRGVIKLIDFGIARHDDGLDLTLDGTTMGTLGYISPEQKDGYGTVDHRADIYSTGATLHALLLGRCMLDLYMAEREPEMMQDIPEPLREPILRATRYRADDRYQTISEFGKALFDARAQLDDDPIDTPSLVVREDITYTDEIDRFLPSSPPEPHPVVLADNEATGSVPAIARDALLRPQEEIATQRRLQMLTFQNVALGSLPLWTLLAMITLITFLRGSALHRARDTTLDYENRLTRVIQAEEPMLDELAGIGADEAALAARWKAMTDAAGPDRTALALELKELAASEFTEHEPSPGSSQMHLARSAQQRIKRLGTAAQHARAAAEFEADARNKPLAGLAVRTGLAPGPRR